MKLSGTSTLRDGEGNVLLEWSKTSLDKARQDEMFRETVAALTKSLPKYPPVKPPSKSISDLCAVYPVGDHHIGMLSWAEETGDNYDINISENLLAGAFDNLVAAAPPCEDAAVIFLGDFLHYDSFESVTPTSRNQLDTDSRYPKMVRAAIRMMRYAIKRTLEKHERVRVIVEIGNHDLSSSIFLMECLSNVYYVTASSVFILRSACSACPVQATS